MTIKAGYSKVGIMQADSFSKFQKLVFNLTWNSCQKINAAMELQAGSKYSSISFYLAAVAQGELAKLLLLPFAWDTPDLSRLLKNIDSSFVNQDIRNKIFQSYGLKYRSRDEIDLLSLRYIYIRDQQEQPQSTDEDALREIVSCSDSLAKFIIRLIFQTNFSQEQKEDFMFLLKSMNECSSRCLLRDTNWLAGNASDMLEKINGGFGQDELYRDLFTNPYTLIAIFKDAFGEGYKEQLVNLRDMKFEDMVDYLNSNLEGK